MYYSKKILLFISHIYGDYQKDLCQGVMDAASEYGFRTEVYSTSDGEDLGKYGDGEASILRIPNYDDVSGVIVASGTYPEVALKEQIIKSVSSKSNCPIVEITDLDTIYPSVSLENNMPIGELTKHLITVHKYKRICYLGCKNERFFSDKREKLYRDVMAQHSLTVEEHDVFLSDYSTVSVSEALDFFKETGLPEAVVCYNDRLALLLMTRLASLGYSIPEDVAIVGCDEIPEGQHISPNLTTITFPIHKMGQEAVAQLMHILKGEDYNQKSIVFATPHYGGSCGCVAKPTGNPLIYGHSMKSKIQTLESSMFLTMKMASDLSHIEDIDEGMDIIANYIELLSNDCKEFYICLFPDWDAVASPILELTGEVADALPDDNIHMVLGIKDKKRLPSCVYSNKSLIPEFVSKDSDSTYIISPLSFGKREFGYIVSAYYNNSANYEFRFVQLISNITSFLNSLCEAKTSVMMQRKLFDIYMKDPLTGLLNRLGHDNKLESLLSDTLPGSEITVFMIDMDHLKKINDEYGHAEGDFAIQILAQAIKKHTTEDMVCTRFGGDEFCIVSNSLTDSTAKDLTSHIAGYLSNYNALGSKPYSLSASIGYSHITYKTDMTLADIHVAFDEADEQMYQIKKHNNNTRENGSEI